MKIAALTRYDRLGASSRMRFIQFFPLLSEQGIAVDNMPLFSDAYVHALQTGRGRLLTGVRGVAGRVRNLRECTDYDVLWLEKEALPWLPAVVEQGLLPVGKPLVLDYDDAVFHQYELHGNALVRWLLGTKHAQLMRQADLVVAGNEYIAEHARSAGARYVEVLPTVVDLTRYSAPSHRISSPGSPVNIGWIGQRSTANFLQPLVPLMVRLAREGLAHFSAIGIDTVAFNLPMTAVAWSEVGEARAIGGMDIGIMPLPDGAFERGKCGYKLIQYMACGLPVVASPVGVNRQIVEHGVNGFLAESPEDWEAALRILAADPELRLRMGEAGRHKVEQQYSLQAIGPHLVDLLRHVACKS